MPAIRTNHLSKSTNPILATKHRRTASVAKELEVIEISSDEESPKPGPVHKMRRISDGPVTDLHALVSQLREDLVRVRAANDAHKHCHLRVLKSVECAICYATMRSPLTLVDCGHTFCHPCLEVWFNSTFRQQRSDLPEGLGDLPHMITYRCPGCRTEVTKNPIKNYSITSVIDAAAVAIDQSPQMVNTNGEDRPLKQLFKYLD